MFVIIVKNNGKTWKMTHGNRKHFLSQLADAKIFSRQRDAEKACQNHKHIFDAICGYGQTTYIVEITKTTKIIKSVIG